MRTLCSLAMHAFSVRVAECTETFTADPEPVLKQYRNEINLPLSGGADHFKTAKRPEVTISSYIESASMNRLFPLLFLFDQPCLCLCFGFSQIIMMLPFLLITLHFSQMGFTDDRTFMIVLLL